MNSLFLTIFLSISHFESLISKSSSRETPTPASIPSDNTSPIALSTLCTSSLSTTQLPHHNYYSYHLLLPLFNRYHLLNYLQMNSGILLLSKSCLLSLSLCRFKVRPRRALGGRLPAMPCRYVIYFLFCGWDFDQCRRRCRGSGCPCHRLGSSRRMHQCMSLKSPSDTIHVWGCD